MTLQSQGKAQAQWAISPSQRVNSDPLLDCLVILTEHFGTPCSAEALSAGLPITEAVLSPELLPQAASRAGLTAKLNRKGLDGIPGMLLPCILMLKDQKACVLQELDFDNDRAVISLPETGGQDELTIAELETQYVGYLFLIKQQYRGDKLQDVHHYQHKEHWL
jgi:ATP-binding cassette subfamily C protein LapB